MSTVNKINSLLSKIDNLTEFKQNNESKFIPNIPTKMQAIHVINDKLELILVDIPKLESQCVLLKVFGSAVNRADLLQAAGKYPPPKGASTIIGLECSGIIVQYSHDCKYVGKQNSEYQLNTSVMALLTGGGYAQYVSVHESNILKINPNKINMNIACAIPEVFLTAYQLLYYYGKPNKNDVVLIHAGASGVGTTLIQYCKHLQLNAFVTCGSQNKIDYCIQLGAKGGANYKTSNFADELLKLYKNGANIVLDCVGQSHWYNNLKCIALEGRWVLYGWLSGSIIKPQPNDNGVNMGMFLRKRIQFSGTTLRARTVEYKHKLMKDFERDIMPLIYNGTIKPIVSKLSQNSDKLAIFDMKNAQKAHDFIRKNANIGKVVLINNK